MIICVFTEKPEVAPKPTKRELVEKQKEFEFVVDVKGKPGEKMMSAEEVELEVSTGELSERLSETSEIVISTEVKDKEYRVSVRETEVSALQPEIERFEVEDTDVPESKLLLTVYRMLKCWREACAVKCIIVSIDRLLIILRSIIRS